MRSLLTTLIAFFSFNAHASPRPVIVFVHGGAWVSGHSSDYVDLAARLEKLGFCTKLVDYRLAPQAKHPAPVQDLDEALKDLKLDKSCDSGRIYLVGHSAGAHMIAFWASAHSRPEIKGFIGLEGIYDIPDLVHVWPSYEEQFVRAEFGPASAWPAASPTRLKFTNQSRWLVIHSKADELVDLPQSKNFCDHLRALKIPFKFIQLENEDHFGVVQSFGTAGSPISKAFTDFVRETTIMKTNY